MPVTTIGITIDLLVATWGLSLSGLIISFVASNEWVFMAKGCCERVVADAYTCLLGTMFQRQARVSIVYQVHPGEAAAGGGAAAAGGGTGGGAAAAGVGAAAAAAGTGAAAGAAAGAAGGAKAGDKAPADSSAGSSVSSAEESAAPLLALAVFGLLAIPVVCTIVALVFGGVLALADGWNYMSGFKYILSQLAAMGNPLTNASPTSAFGEVVTLAGALLALSLQATLFGMMGNLSAIVMTHSLMNEEWGVSKADLKKRVVELEDMVGVLQGGVKIGEENVEENVEENHGGTKGGGGNMRGHGEARVGGTSESARKTSAGSSNEQASSTKRQAIGGLLLPPLPVGVGGGACPSPGASAPLASSAVVGYARV
jgi:hypothetical protein